MRRFAAITAMCVLTFSFKLYARDKVNNSPLLGKWNCIAHGTDQGDLPFTLDVQNSGEGYMGSVSAPQGDTDLTTVTFKDGQLKITIDTNKHNYLLTAKLDDGKLAGEWLLDGQRKGSWEGNK